MGKLTNRTFRLLTTLFLLILALNQNSIAFETFYRNNSFPMTHEAKNNYFKNIKPLLDKRCVACHSCREAECQLKLTSPEGVARGATSEIVDGGSLFGVKLRKKLFHDAHGVEEWRDKGFYSVTDSAPGQSRSILMASLINKNDEDHKNRHDHSDLLGMEVQACGDGNRNVDKVPGMPYEMSPLNYDKEFLPLYTWAQLKGVGQFPSKDIIRKITTPNNPKLIKKWEDFFNGSTSKSKWTSRFLYEHLFLAQFYFEEAPGEFFELVRSSTKFPQDIDILPTTHAWKAPSKKRFYYRLRKLHSTIVFKNHLVYKVSNKTLSDLKKNFINKDWGQKQEKVRFNFKITNPLAAFKHIPAISRYKWMLKNAHLLLDISARSQNCRSTGASAPYWDNMLHLFVKPEADVTVVYGEELYDKAIKYLPIPNLTGGKFSPFADYTNDQVKYANIKKGYQKVLRPDGLTFDDIWNGDGTDKNSLVTVLRHEWTASAHKGHLGGNSRSAILIDFATFERYFYLCNVATEVGDGLLWQSRVVSYLFYNKREGEDFFLSLLPNRFRNDIRKNLIQGFDVANEFKAQFTLPYNEKSEKVDIDELAPYDSFIKNFLVKHFSPEIIGSRSFIIKSNVNQADETLKELVQLNQYTSFPRFMPNVSYLKIQNNEGHRFFTMTANRYHKSRNKITILTDNEEYEKTQRVPSKDRLEVYDGIIVNYPEKIYNIKLEQLPTFLREMKSIKSRYEFKIFNSKYGLDQKGNNFWSVIDEANSSFISKNPVTGGIIDLHKYGTIDTKAPL